MANTSAPNGFQDYGRLEGGSPTAGLTTRLISASDTAAVGYGDPVTSQTNGYVSASVAGTTQIDGIFYGCTYLSTAIGRTVWSNFYPGSGATGDVTAYIKDDPQAKFVVQSNNTAITFADIGANINFVAGAPNSVTGFATSAVDQSTISTTATLPFRIVGLLSQDAPPGTSGTDNSSAYNRIIVTANNWDRKSLTGIA
jgi:hypothetical protein